jgi:hypothetical protein
MSAGYRSVVDREVSEKMNGPYVADYEVFWRYFRPFPPYVSINTDMFRNAVFYERYLLAHTHDKWGLYLSKSGYWIVR